MIFRPPLRIIFVVTFYSREDVLYKSGKDGMKMFYLYFDKKYLINVYIGWMIIISRVLKWISSYIWAATPWLAYCSRCTAASSKLNGLRIVVIIRVQLQSRHNSIGGTHFQRSDRQILKILLFFILHYLGDINMNRKKLCLFTQHRFTVWPLPSMLQDLDLIYRGLQALPAFSKLRDSALSGLCAMVRYQRSDANDILYWSVPFIISIWFYVYICPTFCVPIFRFIV